MIEIVRINDPQMMAAYRHLRWELFRKPHGLPPGSEYYDGEENGIHIAALEEGVLVGGMFLMDRGQGNAQGHQMVVREAYRERGIGAALVLYLEELARQQGFTRIYYHVRTYLTHVFLQRGCQVVEAADLPAGLSTVTAPEVPHLYLKKDL
jgi:GNAT superfamily N-acetyltransferase